MLVFGWPAMFAAAAALIGSPSAAPSPAPDAANVSDLFHGARLGMTRVEAALPPRPSLVCEQVTANDPAGSRAETCRGGEAAFLFVPDAQQVHRLVAMTQKGDAAQAGESLEVLRRQWGKPSRAHESSGRKTIVWSKAAQQVTYRQPCADAAYCIEYSDNAFARRVARSTGLFSQSG